MQSPRMRFGLLSIRRTLIWLLIAAMMFSLGGCYAARAEKRAKALTGELETTAKEMQRNVWVAEFTDKSFLKDRGIASTMQRNLLDELTANCPRIRFQPDQAENRIDIPRLPSGELDSYRLALSGRGKGVGAVLIGTITDVRGEEQTLGFWWFEQKVWFVSVHLNIVVFDSETGAKLLDDYFSVENRIEVAQFERLKARDASLEMTEIEDTMKQVAVDAGKVVCDTMKEQPVKIFLSALQGNTMKLTAGGNDGLDQDMELDVYDSSNIMTGKDGQRYAIPGIRTGTVRIVTVTANEATAEIISGKVPNESVCLKPRSE